MDPKEIKQSLKTTKEFLDAKDYKSAIKQCKAILKADRSNYLALVFFGAALQETDQRDEAPKAFKKAIEASPNQLLSWRGLISYYEKFDPPGCQQDLLKAYVKILILEPDLSKCAEVTKKFENLAVALNDVLAIQNLYEEIEKQESEEKKLMLKQSIASALSSYSSVPEALLSAYNTLLFELVSLQPPIANHAEISKKYLKALYKQGKLHDVISEGQNFKVLYPNDVYLSEWICKAYSELTEGHASYSPKDDFLALLNLMPESYLPYLCKGIYEFQNNEILNALDSFNEAVSKKSNYGLAWYRLCQCQILLFRFIDSEYSALQAMKYEKSVNNEVLILQSEVWLVHSLSEQETESKWSEAVEVGNELLTKHPDNLEIVIHLAKALVKLKKYPEARKFLDILAPHESLFPQKVLLDCLILQHSENSKGCQKKLEELTEKAPNFSEGWLELGKLHYFNNNSNFCLSCFLKAAKINPLCYQSFLFLGHTYKTLLNDLEKARRCYQKAFQLNPKSSEAGMCLSDLYRILQKEDLNLQLLSIATSQSANSKWAWLRLGLYYMSTNQQQEAVNTLRVAVRLDASDKNCWECLGDAYLTQGAFTSALKSYTRVTELDSTLIYPVLQIATTKHLLGLFQDSVKEFRLVLESKPDYLPALKGHAEACLSLMNQHLSQNLNGLAVDMCQEAVNSLIVCLRQRKDLICTWKLLADACSTLGGLPEKYCQLDVAAWLCRDLKIEESEIVDHLQKIEVLKLATRSYCKAITISPDSSQLWYDLAIAYNILADANKTFEEKKQTRDFALAAVKKSIKLKTDSWESWNLLGVIYASSEVANYPMAQHCFIQSIKENDKSALTWTNLGTLYLCLGDLQLANQSFAEAQRCDHDYVQCWIGQALIAETTEHHETIDLFRHSTQLGTHPQGSIGYANMVCNTVLKNRDKNDMNYIYSIKNMNAITVACDAMTWYTDRIVDDPCAFNMLGLLQERQKLYRSASNSFFRSLKLLEESKQEEDTIDKVLLNYGRVLVNLKKYEEAITYLKKIKKATFTNQCGIAAAYFQAGLYEEAYNSYETTLEWLAPDAGFKSHILVAMASVVYMHQGQEDAKTLLMQAFQLKPPSVQGLFACCALGMLHSNLPFSELSLKELYQHKDDPEYINHIAIFQAFTQLFKNQKDGAIRALSKTTHRHPEQPTLWLSLCLLLLHLYPSYDSSTAARCAEKTMQIGRSSLDVSKVMSLVSLSNLLSGEGLKSLRSSQKAVHMFPDVTENWIVLIASVLSKCLANESEREVSWLKKIITYVRRKLETSKSMTQWLSNIDRKVSVMAN